MEVGNLSDRYHHVRYLHICNAPVVEDTEIYDEPPKENPKTVKKGAKSSAKGLTKKKTQPDEFDPNLFDVKTEKDLVKWYRENVIFYELGKWEVGQCIM